MAVTIDKDAKLGLSGLDAKMHKCKDEQKKTTLSSALNSSPVLVANAWQNASDKANAFFFSCHRTKRTAASEHGCADGIQAGRESTPKHYWFKQKIVFNNACYVNGGSIQLGYMTCIWQVTLSHAKTQIDQISSDTEFYWLVCREIRFPRNWRPQAC